MYKTYLTILLLTFTLTYACTFSSKDDRGEDNSKELTMSETELTGEVDMKDLRNRAIALKDTLNDKIGRLDSLMVEKNASEKSQLKDLREQFVKEVSEMDSVIYKTINAKGQEDITHELKRQIEEAENLLSEAGAL